MNSTSFLPTNSKNRASTTQTGFTLIELLIALTILAFLGYFTSDSMRTSTQRSQKIRTEIDISREVKAAARVIKGDISRAYNARDIYIAVYNEAQRERVREWQRNQMNPQAQQNPNSQNNPNDPNDPNSENPNNDDGSGTDQQNTQQNQTPPPPYEPREELIVTQFLGEPNKIDLTTLSGVRIRKNVKASDLIEVGYSLQSCKRRNNRSETTNCLWRRISYYLDGEVNVGGESSVLLEDITKFELKYLRVRGDNVEWMDRWMSNQSGDDMSRDALPLAVQLEIEVERPVDKTGENKRRLNVVNYIPIYFTNNTNVKSITQMNAQGNPYENPAAASGAMGGNTGQQPFGGQNQSPLGNSQPLGGQGPGLFPNQQQQRRGF